jgi:CDP-diacylglycerol---glycerol-3-phosphate 3-phosphatidyltransferase
MIAQVVAISFLLLSIRHPNLTTLAHWMMWGVVVFTIASAVDYFRKFWRKVDVRVKKRRRRELLRLERRERRQKLSALGHSGSGVGDFRGTI